MVQTSRNGMPECSVTTVWSVSLTTRCRRGPPGVRDVRSKVQRKHVANVATMDLFHLIRPGIALSGLTSEKIEYG